MNNPVKVNERTGYKPNDELLESRRHELADGAPGYERGGSLSIKNEKSGNKDATTLRFTPGLRVIDRGEV